MLRRGELRPGARLMDAFGVADAETIARARRVAGELGSGALHAVSEHTDQHEHDRGVEIAYAEAPSPRHPDHSDDRILSSEAGYIGVFDGVGGNYGSERAAEMASHAIDNHIAGIDRSLGAEHVASRLEHAIRMTDSAIKRFNESNGQNVATTLATGVIVSSDTGRKLVWGVVGDSRIGIYNPQRDTYRNLSLDETPSNLQLDSREAWARQQRFDTARTHEDFAALSPEDQGAYSSQTILRYLGGQKSDTHSLADTLQVGIIELTDNDEIACMTDGIIDNVSGPELVELLQQGGTLQQKVQRIDTRAEEVMHDTTAARRKPDDRALVMMRV